MSERRKCECGHDLHHGRTCDVLVEECYPEHGEVAPGEELVSWDEACTCDISTPAERRSGAERRVREDTVRAVARWNAEPLKRDRDGIDRRTPVEELDITDGTVNDAATFEEIARGTTVAADALSLLLRASRTEEPTEGAPRSRGESDE